jgi:8-oxo-dGTP pyrophosphatase MutT (NUDIX family)
MTLPSYRPPRLGPAPQPPQRETAGAFLRRGDRYLLALRPADKSTYPALWDTPGGHLEAGEAADTTLFRELEEELKIRPIRYYLVGALDDLEAGIHYRHHIFLVTQWRGEVRVVEESDAEIWATLLEIRSLPNINRVTQAAARILETWARELE